MGIRGFGIGFTAILLGTALACLAGCPKKVRNTVKTIQTMASSPRMVSVERTVYDIDLADWGPDFFSMGSYQGKPIVAYRSPAGLVLAVAGKQLPRDASDWQTTVIDTRPKARMIKLAESEGLLLVSYVTDRKEAQRSNLAICNGKNPGELNSWIVEELPSVSGRIVTTSLTISGSWLGFACYEGEAHIPSYLRREREAVNTEWTEVNFGNFRSGGRGLALLDLAGEPVLGFSNIDDSILGMLVDSTSNPGNWQKTIIARGTTGDFASTWIDFASNGKSAGVVYLQGEPPDLRYAHAADVTLSSPNWQINDLISWDMLGVPDLLFNDDRPVVAFEADTGMFAFFAKTANPAGSHDWLMCQISEDLGKEGFNGVNAMINDGHLLAVYLKLTASQQVTLSATVIEFP